MRKKIIVISMIILLIALFYMIFNMGSETAIQRFFITDPSKDIWLLLAIGLGVFSLNLLMMRDAQEQKDNNDKR
ncbi:MAG: hypothetical protein DRP60_13385 [Spirochaetes bacterium]|nr:MAG: hypothetical protein DRP60_13385 [Spirochaetota bacterium]